MAEGEPDLEQVLKSARSFVKDAIEAGTLKELTPRIVRARIENALGLPSKVLDGSEYKSAIGKAIEAVTKADTEEHSTKKDRKRKSSVVQDRKKPSKRVKHGQSERESEEDKPKKARKVELTSEAEQSEDDTNTPEKSKPTSVPKRKASDTNTKGKKSSSSDKGKKMGRAENIPSREVGRKFLSAALIVDSDDEMDASTSAPTKIDNKAKMLAQTSPRQTVSKAPGTTSSAPDSSVSKVKQAKNVSEGQKSESEMSVLIDEPPKRKAKSKGKDTESKSSVKKVKEPKAPRPKKTAEVLSKDEETIKRLKSFVVACGVRKVWAKEFKDLDTPYLQIERLKRILSDLGMTGRMSIEQAKSIRAQREFAQELEDVKTFEQSVVGGSKRSISAQSSSKQAAEDNQEEEKGSEEDGEDLPKKRVNARRSIMDFLGDQSDDD